jgi:hypothetical protein
LPEVRKFEGRANEIARPLLLMVRIGFAVKRLYGANKKHAMAGGRAMAWERLRVSNTGRASMQPLGGFSEERLSIGRMRVDVVQWQMVGNDCEERVKSR